MREVDEMVTRLEKERGIYVLTLDRPNAGNSISLQVTREMAAHLDLVERDQDALALIITGAGERFFCTGGDVKEYATLATRDEVKAQFSAMQRVCERIGDLPIPVVAALNGMAVGGGVELALACDFRVAHPDVTLRLPQVQLGLVTGWGAHWRLVRLLGEARALDLLLTARPVMAGEALALGLINRVGTSALEEALCLAEELRPASPLALRAMKAAVRLAGSQTYQAAVVETSEWFYDLWFSEDHREAEHAFAERRAPRFQGR